eukprot:CAMPEP_0174253674 /NCGR_PEP_ID=MMETSP0439-20130205/3044_1 /TAXON_ID=0 /ORGANISM="Stereomyxa ramosa, Strain Chinc5" /LENGTH=589 /DNA_ID=CAMNT_0015334835 /DNA_START=9 /DNA_END=1778 /DNA_ORIENTATION=-
MEEFTCVQCGCSFNDSENNEGACRYYVNSSRNAEEKRSKHRKKHHCDYPYASFFQRTSGIFGYSDTLDCWLDMKDKNLASGDEFSASAGQILRWNSRGNHVSEPTFFVKIGHVWWTSKYYFMAFNEQELDQLGKSLSDGETEIFKTHDGSQEYACGWWVVEDSAIIALKLEVKAATSPEPKTMVVKFNAFPLTKGEVLLISKGGFVDYKPTHKYPIPDDLYCGPVIDETEPRKARQDFKTHGPLKIIVKEVPDSPIKCNDRARDDADIFTGSVSIINAQSEVITIVDVKVEWRLVGDEEWKPADEVHFNPPLLSVEPRRNDYLTFTIVVKDEEKEQLGIRWFRRSWVARHRPIRFKFTFEEMTCGKCFQVLEFVSPVFGLPERKEGDVMFIKLDDPNLRERHVVKATKGYRGQLVLEGNDLEDDDFRGIAYKACEEGKGEYELDYSAEKDDYWWKSYALVDLNCKRVYAIKVIAGSKYSAAVAYIGIELYGDSEEEREPLLVDEQVLLPDVKESWSGGPYPQDDDFDDNPVESLGMSDNRMGNNNNNNNNNSTGPGNVVVDLSQLTSVLLNIDSNLQRIADSLEVLAKK